MGVRVQIELSSGGTGTVQTEVSIGFTGTYRGEKWLYRKDRGEYRRCTGTERSECWLYQVPQKVICDHRWVRYFLTFQEAEKCNFVAAANPLTG